MSSRFPSMTHNYYTVYGCACGVTLLCLIQLSCHYHQSNYYVFCRLLAMCVHKCVHACLYVFLQVASVIKWWWWFRMAVTKKNKQVDTEHSLCLQEGLWSYRFFNNLIWLIACSQQLLQCFWKLKKSSKYSAVPQGDWDYGKKKLIMQRERKERKGRIVYELYDCTVFLIWETAHRKSGHIAVFSQRDLQKAPGVCQWPLLKLQPDQVSTIQKIFWALARFLWFHFDYESPQLYSTTYKGIYFCAIF